MSEVANTQLTEKKAAPCDRFTAKVLEQATATGNIHFSDKEKRLIQGYYINIDQMLRNVEAERVAKNAKNTDHKFDKTVPCTWANIDIESLVSDLARYAKIGLDMTIDNTLFAIPYLDKSGKYTVTLMPGYNGICYEAKKYALVPYKDVIIEVVYSTDKFKAIKKDATHSIESYEFEVTNPFERGNPIGVFGYIVYDDPTMNKLVVFSKADVEKRKPKGASASFWGGTKVSYENGKRVETELEGWVTEMYEKTMKREIYGAKHMPRDPEKLDDAMKYMEERVKQYKEIMVNSEIIEKANSQELVIPENVNETNEVRTTATNTSVIDDIPTPDPNF